MTTPAVFCIGCGIRNREAQALLEEAEARYARLADAAITLLNVRANQEGNPLLYSLDMVEDAATDLRAALGLPA